MAAQRDLGRTHSQPWRLDKVTRETVKNKMDRGPVYVDLWGNVEIHSEVKKKRPKSRLSGLEITEEEKLGKGGMIKGIGCLQSDQN